METTQPENEATQQTEKWRDAADRISDKLNADLILYSGSTLPPFDYELVGVVSEKRSRPNVVFILITSGGLADSSYRIARCLRRSYKHVVACVPWWCKSAGTLVVLGADSIVMGDVAELGPLDVQYSKHDEVGERSSGLTPTQSLSGLKVEAFGLFEKIFRELRSDQLRFPTRAASQVATEITTGLLSGIYSHIDPLRLGEIQRAQMVASHYGERLRTDNVKDGTIDKLLTGFPSHGFVIDREEARELFNDVREPDDDLLQLWAGLASDIQDGQKKSREVDGGATILFLSKKAAADGNQNANDKTNTERSGEAGENPSGESGSSVQVVAKSDGEAVRVAD